jgi:DNA transposition AAA+ family ATPase
MSTVTTTAPASASFTISAVDFEQVLKTVYTEEQAEVLRFWFFSARDRLWSLSRLAEATGISPTSLTRVFRGIYPTNPAEIIAKLARARETFHESSENPKFIETSLSKRLFAIFDKTRALRNVSILWGRMGIGKTVCIAEYQRRNNHGRTQVVRFPSGSTFSYFVTHIARGCGISTSSQSAFEQRGKIIQILSAGQRLLIIDELHQAFTSYQHGSAVKVFEVIREIYDRTHCGLVLVGTNVLRDELSIGRLAPILEQLRRRGTIKVQLPSRPPKVDLDRIAKRFNLPPAEGLAADVVKDMILTSGLGMYIKFLQSATMLAAKDRKKPTWDHFVQAHDIIASLSQKREA